MRLTTGLASLILLALLAACASSRDAGLDVAMVMPAAETVPMAGEGDRADDPAIWVHPSDPAASRILATNKDEGLHVYALDGRELQVLPVGPLNNVDLRQGESGDGKRVDLAVASHDGINAVSVFTIARTDGRVAHISDLPTGKAEPYGICLAETRAGALVGVTYKDGTVQVWIIELADGEVVGSLLRSVGLSGQPEGCVFDEVNGQLYIGEEGRGIWRLDTASQTSRPQAVDMIADRNGLAEDVEGLSIWRGSDGEGWLVASAQGADRYVVYDRKPPNAPRGLFRIIANEAAGLDGVTHTDGLDVSARPLPGYPRGLLVVQDDANPDKGVDQNFKLVDWAGVEAALALPRLAPENGGVSATN